MARADAPAVDISQADCMLLCDGMHETAAAWEERADGQLILVYLVVPTPTKDCWTLLSF